MPHDVHRIWLLDHAQSDLSCWIKAAQTRGYWIMIWRKDLFVGTQEEGSNSLLILGRELCPTRSVAIISRRALLTLDIANTFSGHAFLGVINVGYSQEAGISANVVHNAGIWAFSLFVPSLHYGEDSLEETASRQMITMFRGVCAGSGEP
jgi:hypothetical protein